MTTIACNLKEISSDSKVGSEGVGKDSFRGDKLYIAGDRVLGITGDNCDGALIAIDWFKAGAKILERPVPPKRADWIIIELSRAGIAVYNTLLEREDVREPFTAVGSGRKAALYCMKVLGKTPGEAVYGASLVDEYTAPPIMVAKLSDMVVRKWIPTKKGKKKT